MSANCSSCGAAIIWAKTKRGRMPVDALPSEGGNVALEDDGRSVTAIVYAAKQRPQFGVFYKSHFATCPNAEKHRRAPKEGRSA